MLFPWVLDPESIEPDLERAKKRVDAYSFKKPFKEKIQRRREFYEKCREDGDLSVVSYRSVITVASSVRVAWHSAAYGEGALAESFLWFIRKDEGPEVVASVLSDLFNWKVEYEGDGEFWVHWTELFTAWGKELPEGQVELPYKPRKCPVCGSPLDGPVCSFCGKTVELPEVEPGMVKTGFRFLARSFREYIVSIVVSDCEAVSEEVGDEYRDQCYELFPKLKERKKKVAKKAGRFPPCIKRLLERAQEGENLSHEERFHLATFLINIGWDLERVVGVFSNLPDFDEERTRYQVRHLAGEVGGGTKYLPYGCEKARIKGVCPGENCGVKHPLQYYYKGGEKR